MKSTAYIVWRNIEMTRILRTVFAIVLIAGITLCSGCGKSIEIENIGFILGAGFDRTEEGDVKVWIQIAMPTPNRDEIMNLRGWIATATGQNVFEAINNVSRKMAKKLFWGHATVLIVGERMARDGVDELVEYITRNAEFRYTSLMAVTSEDIGEILLLEMSSQSRSAADISGLFYTAQRISIAPKSTFYDFITKSEEVGNEAILGRISIIEDSASKQLGTDSSQEEPESETHNDKELLVEGCAVFHKDKMIGWLDGEQTSMALMLRNHMYRYEGMLDLPGGFLGYVITQSNVTMKTENLDVNALEDLTVKVEAIGSADITAIWSDETLTSVSDIKMLNEMVSDQIKQKLENLIFLSQKVYKVDFTDIGEKVRQKVPMKLWEDGLSEQWNDIYQNINVEVSVNLKIRRRGLTFNQVDKHY